MKEEYIFTKAEVSIWQRWLNQWKHNYDLNILKIVDHKDGECTIYLLRTPLEK